VPEAPETTSLYRRHRPQAFDEVVGQEHVVRTLRNAVEQGKVHHAYLFVGSRGTGKTSMAKILARSLNCVKGPTVTPCGECESCRTIAAGTSLDVIEMDAASNRSVDDIRDLRERVGYAPAAGHWKVYILDEAHMLTKEAWNAFLKTLEEPPPNTVFVLATTEAHKVMPTIVDRCQRFDFRRPSLEEIAEVVRRVSAAEQIDIAEPAVALVSRSAGGSFRDALGTLDQLVAYGGAKVSLDDVLSALGVADADLLFDTADAFAAGDPKGVLAASERLAASGRDASQFARDLISHLRQLLVLRTTGEVPDSFSVTAANEDRLRAQAAALQDATLVRAIDVLSAAVAAIREGDEARMTVEVALLKIADPSVDPSQEALLARIERLEGGGASASGEKRAEPAPAKPKPTPQAEEPPAQENSPPDEQPAAQEEPPADPPKAAVELDRITQVWPAIIDQVRQSGAEVLSHAFEAARPIAVDTKESVLKIGFPMSATFNKRKAEVKANQEKLAEALRKVVGERLRPIYVLLEGEEQRATEEISEDEVFERMKSEFEAEEVEAGNRAEEAG
jgi:DNA polymerase-3 subunit gamma/tau